MKNADAYILMLEDDSDDRYITQTVFSEKGYNIPIEFLTNTEYVLPFLQQCIDDSTTLPALILLDKNVPASGGLKVLENIKGHPSFRAIPVVMISGTAYPEDVNESYRLGVNSFIVKPFGSEQTANTIETFVNYWFGISELPTIPTDRQS
jgi:CheY-like chemotaxis protein